MNATEIIKKDLDAIYIGNLSTVDDNLTLPENGKYGAQFTWETGEEDLLTIQERYIVRCMAWETVKLH